jgi:hypothetical protein
VIIGKPYQYPPAKFQPGEWVRFYLSEDIQEHGRGAYQVAAADHCFTWFDEFPHQISNWRLRRVHKSRQKSTGEPLKRDRRDHVTINDKNLPTSEENSLKSTHPTGECSIYFSQIDLWHGFQLFKLFPIFKKIVPLEEVTTD